MDDNRAQTPFEKATEAAGWLRIFLSPFLTGLIIGAAVYLAYPNQWTLTASVLILLAAAGIGARFATKIKNEKGSIHFISRTSASPELDEKLDKKNDTR